MQSLYILEEHEEAKELQAKVHHINSHNFKNKINNLCEESNRISEQENQLKINNDYALAILKKESGDLNGAINLFQNSIYADPKMNIAYAGAAECYLQLGNFDEAESFVVQALTLSKVTPGANKTLGIVFENKENIEKAIEYYRKELEVNPKDHEALRNLGILEFNEGQILTTIELLKKALEIKPDQKCSLYLSLTYQKLGRSKEAIREYKKLEVNSQNRRLISFNLGLCYLQEGITSNAITSFKEAISADKQYCSAWINLGKALQSEGRFEEALSVTLEAVRLEPDNPTGYTNLGGIHKTLGNLDKALNYTLKSLQISNNNPTAQMNLGGIYKEMGLLNQAREATLKALELKPDNAIAYKNLGGIHNDLGNLDLALKYTLKSLELRPNDPVAHTNLGGIYLGLGKLEESQSSSLISLKLRPNNAKAFLTLGMSYFYQEDLDKACKAIHEAIQLNPKYAECYRQLSLILLARGDAASARSNFKIANELDPQANDNGLISFILSRSARDIEQDKETNSLSQILPQNPLEYPITLRREVEPELVESLYQFNSQDLNEMNDPTYGNARGSAYNLFENNGEKLFKVRNDLMDLVQSTFNSEAYFKEGFYTILSGPSIVKKHYHLTELDKHKGLNLKDKKFALVYYLKTGDQECQNPGALKFYEPDQEILPHEGMVIIFPASRYHSVKYEGDKDRVIIGINFYIK